MGHNNIIELNGKRYDAITGAYLGKSHAQPVPAVPSKAARTIDGVRRTQPSTKQTQAKSSQKPDNKPHKKQDDKSDHNKTHHSSGKSSKSHTKHNRSTQHAKPHRPERAKTLMRSAVQKPAAQPKTLNGVVAKPANNLEFKKAAHNVDGARLNRSLQVPKHHDVQRFNEAVLPDGQATVQPTPAAQQSASQPPNIPTVQISEPQHLRPADIFETAVARATSHEQPAPKLKPSRSKRALRASLVAAALLAVIGGFVWLQRPTIELKVASMQAGFQADQPGHNLTGYARESTQYNSGQVIITFRSGDRHYKIAQQKSGWNSQTLLDTAVLGAATTEPQTVESRGRIVYLYKTKDESWNAAWVDGGVRFELTGNAYMTKDDISAIVDSM